MKKCFFAFLLVIWLFSCNDNSHLDIPPIEERIAQSSQELIDQLTNPDFGWRLDYRPTTNAGTFLILLDFNNDGTVRIQSDVADENGIYLDQTVSYRVDQDLATELILETYAVFHYLFEQNQNSFGGEFEFIFEGEESGNLIFSSKSDLGIPTELVFQPAQLSDDDLISTEIVSQLSQGSYRTGTLAGINATPVYQIYLPSDNVSIFSSFDLSNRRALVHGAAIGRTFDEVTTSATTTNINRTTDLSFLSEEVIFENPVTFSIDNRSYTLSSFNGSNFQVLDTSFCVGSTDTYVSLEASLASIGTSEMNSSLFTSHSAFIDDDTEFYQINDLFMFDENDNTIQEDVLSAFPNSIVFVLVVNGVPRGFEDGTFTGLGWVGVDQNNSLEFFLREMDITNSTGNLLELSLTDGTFITVADSLDERDALFSLTDRVFEGGSLFGLESLSTDNLFEVYNPCNGYKFFLIE